MNSKKTEVEPHCSGHEHFEYDCIDCSDALERMRRGASPGDGTYTIPEDKPEVAKSDVANLPAKCGTSGCDPAVCQCAACDPDFSRKLLDDSLAKPASGDGLLLREINRVLNGDILQTLLNVSNGIDSPASASIAASAVVRLDYVKDLIRRLATTEQPIEIAGVRDTLIVAANNPVAHGGLEGLRQIMRKQAERLRATEQPGSSVQAALDYLHPHLDAGTFAAPDWAIDLASILTGGKRVSTPPAPAAEQEN